MKIIGFVLVAGLVSGCAMADADKFQRATDDPRERDAALCKFEARSRSGQVPHDQGLLGVFRIAEHRQRNYEDCMLARGWKKQ